MVMNENRKEEEKETRVPYSPPAIVYEGIITARAGSLAPGVPDEDSSGVGPIDLFGSDG